MRIEIVANYPKYRTQEEDGTWKTVGTIHAYLPDFDLDIRGIHYLWKKNKCHIRLPSRKGEIDGEACEFLVFSFCSGEKQRMFIKALKTAVADFSKTDLFDKLCSEIRCENSKK